MFIPALTQCSRQILVMGGMLRYYHDIVFDIASTV